jgi:MEMO1 family protein
MRWKVLALVLGAAVIVGGCGGGDESGKGDGKGDQKAGAAKTDGGATTAPGSATNASVKRADSDIREPAVAGLWYPADRRELAKAVDSLLTATVAGVPGKVRGIIVPHAAYPFSGITAAVAFKQVMGQNIDTVYLLGASHTATYDGASIPPFKAFRTPLGDVPVSPKAAELAKAKPFVGAPFVEIKQRPAKPDDCSKLAPPAGQETPHTWEHSIECQLPFLQWTLKGFQLVPILYGRVDPDAVARALIDKIDDKSLIVVSTDLSHYHPIDEAKSLDAWSIKAVQEMDLPTMAKQQACALPAVMTLMQIAKDRGWKPYVLDYRTSGDVSDKAAKDRVVGYMAVVFTEGPAKEEPLAGPEKEFLLKLARMTAASVVQGKGLPKVDRASLTPNLLTPKGAFVTLKEDNKLRGCMGYTVALKPLYLTVMETAANAAVRDGRFKPVTPDELDKIVFEISVLTLPKSIYYNTPPDLLTALRPKVDGVVLEVPVVNQGRQTLAQSVYLPAVWEEIPDPEKFMNMLSQKAGLVPNAWRQPQARVLTFQADEFKEPKAGGPAPAATAPAK